jgi:hypothetical protein
MLILVGFVPKFWTCTNDAHELRAAKAESTTAEDVEKSMIAKTNSNDLLVVFELSEN